MKGTWTDPLTPARTATPKVGWHPRWKGCLGLSLSQRHRGARCSGCFLEGLEADAQVGAEGARRREAAPSSDPPGPSSELQPWSQSHAPSERSPECGQCRVRHGLPCARQLPCLLPAASGAGHDGGQPCFKATDVILEHSCRLPLSTGCFAVSISGSRSSHRGLPSLLGWTMAWKGLP